MFYIAIFLVLAVLAQSRPKETYVPALLALYLFVAFRWEVGCDWQGYLYQYRVWRGDTLNDALFSNEPFWRPIFFLQHQLGLEYQWLNVVAAIPFFAGIHAIARREPNPTAFLALVFPVLILNMPMAALRQSIAIGIMCFAYLAFVDKKTIRYIILVLIAAGFHTSALPFVILALFIGRELSWRMVASAVVVVVPAVFLFAGSDSAQTAAQRYLGSDIEASGAYFRTSTLAITGLAYLLLLNRSWREKYPRSHALVLIASVLMIMTIPLAIVSTVIGDRYAYYVMPLQATILARLPYFQQFRDKPIIAWLPYIAMVGVLLVWSLLSSHYSYCYDPYLTWLFGTPESRLGLFY